MHIHICIYMFWYALIRAGVHTHMYPHIHIHTHTYDTLMFVHGGAGIFFLLPEGTVTFRSALTWALHVYTCTRMYTHTCMHIRIYAYTSALPYHGFINIYVHTLTYMHINVYPHTYTHVYVYTHTYMDIRIYVYTYIQLYFQRGRSAVPYHGLLDRMPL